MANLKLDIREVLKLVYVRHFNLELAVQKDFVSTRYLTDFVYPSNGQFVHTYPAMYVQKKSFQCLLNCKKNQETNNKKTNQLQIKHMKYSEKSFFLQRIFTFRKINCYLKHSSAISELF